jgi:predicted NBD/HSP70 family sugar kinase
VTAHAIAVDVGGIEMKAGLVIVDRDTARPLRRPTPLGTETADRIVGTITELVSDLRADADDLVDAVVSGVVDEARGGGVFSADVTAAVRAGTQAVWQDSIDALARGLLVLVTVAAPACIVLGGGFARAGKLSSSSPCASGWTACWRHITALTSNWPSSATPRAASAQRCWRRKG